MANDNKMLGNFNLEGIAPAPRGVPQIEVTFDIDANGIVSVSAKDKGTGKEQKITIKADGGLSEDEINKMVKEAEANKEADKKKRDLVEAKNQAETLTHQIEKQLKEHGEKISAEEKKAIEDANTEMTEEQILDEFDQNVSEDFASVMSSESRILQPTSVTVMKEKVIKSNGMLPTISFSADATVDSIKNNLKN